MLQKLINFIKKLIRKIKTFLKKFSYLQLAICAGLGYMIYQKFIVEGFENDEDDEDDEEPAEEGPSLVTRILQFFGLASGEAQLTSRKERAAEDKFSKYQTDDDLEKTVLEGLGKADDFMKYE